MLGNGYPPERSIRNCLVHDYYNQAVEWQCIILFRGFFLLRAKKRDHVNHSNIIVSTHAKTTSYGIIMAVWKNHDRCIIYIRRVPSDPQIWNEQLKVETLSGPVHNGLLNINAFCGTSLVHLLFSVLSYPYLRRKLFWTIHSLNF